MEHLKPLLDGDRVARHFQDDVDADPAIELADVLNRRRRGRKDRRRTHLLSQLAAVGVGLDAVDRRRTLGPRDADRAETDGTQPEDRDRVVLERTGRSGVDRIPERLLQGGDLRAQAWGVPPAVLRRQQHVAGEGPVPIDAQHTCVLAEVVKATPALAAGVVDDMGLGRDKRPGCEVFDLRSGGDDPPRHLVTEHPRRMDVTLGPLIPVEDVDVGPADGGGGDLDQDVRALGLRDVDLVDLGARTGSGFHHCRHGRHGFILAAAKPVS